MKESSTVTTKSLFKEALSLINIVVLALAIRILVFEPFYIPSGSMKSTLEVGDYIFSTKYSYGYSRYSIPFHPDIFSGRIFPKEPERGDVVIFRSPHFMSERFIKRLIGLPGDKIQLIKSTLYINDQPVEREFIQNSSEANYQFKQYIETLPNGKKYYIQQLDATDLSPVRKLEVAFMDNIGPFFVPKDHYFFLGDNRNQSGDSRFEMGFIPFDNLISKVQCIFFAFKEPLWLSNVSLDQQIKQIWLWLSSFRAGRMFKSLDVK